MADYIIGGILVVCVVLALRSYFGRKYSQTGCSGCSGCARAQQCMQAKENVDKKVK